MTTKTDRARECAEEIGKRFAGEWIAGPDIEELTEIITKHFPPSVPVSKLEHLLRNSETFGWRTANWVAAIRGLIAEAK